MVFQKGHKGFRKIESYQKPLSYKISKEGCWICVSHTLDKDGYAIFQRNKKWQRIHRYMYEKENGKIPNGKLISHRCNNHSCINPDHLFSSNVKEIKKIAGIEGRNAFGERSGSSKLKNKQVIKIFKDRLTPKKLLAKKYKVGKNAIWNIQSRRLWKNITSEVKLIQTKEWLKKYKEKRVREWWKRYRKKNKLKMNKYDNKYKKMRMEKDPEYRIARILRHYLSQTLKEYTKTGKIMPSKKYSIDYNAIIEHIKPFPKDLSNYQIHHIKPLFTFNFINKDGSQNLEAIKEAFKPENHKLVTIEEHRKINHWKLNNKTL